MGTSFTSGMSYPCEPKAEPSPLCPASPHTDANRECRSKANRFFGFIPLKTADFHSIPAGRSLAAPVAVGGESGRIEN